MNRAQRITKIAVVSVFSVFTLSLALIGYLNGYQTTEPASDQSAAVYQSVQQPPQDTQNQQPDLSNSNYYTNSVGNTVHSPAYTEDNSVPVGASARCNDGTYSFSQSRRGTCSHHGGVAEWI